MLAFDPTLTEAELVRQHIYSVVSDLYKDIYGIRPRWMAGLSVESLTAEYNDLFIQLREERLREERDAAAHLQACQSALTPKPINSLALFFP